MPDEQAWRTIFGKDLAMMAECGAVVANLTPFRGAPADAGTLVELGRFLGRGLPAFGYSNRAEPFDARSRAQVEAVPDQMPGLSVADFGLPDNLMIAGALLEGAGHPMVLPPDGCGPVFDALDVFERCVEVPAWRLALRPPPAWADA
jgi:nucleoside 2-deoxyribosyltransferase